MEGPPDRVLGLRLGRPRARPDARPADEPAHVRPAAPEIASRGYRVITIDTLGHGASDRPEDMHLYSMPAFGEQIAALSTTWSSTGPSSAAPRSARTRRLSSASRTRASRAGSSSRCPSSTTRSSARRSPSRRCSWALRFGRPLLAPLSALLRRVPADQPPGGHRPRLAAPGSGPVPRRARGNPVPPHGPAA